MQCDSKSEPKLSSEELRKKLRSKIKEKRDKQS